MIRPGSHVRTRHGKVGIVLEHHTTLPAWIVRFGREAFPIAYYDTELEVI